MLNFRKYILTINLVIVMVCLCALGVQASPATSYTMARNAKGRLVRTQDAYLPERTIIELDLQKPQDLFFGSDDILYIADTGNRRILKYDPQSDRVLLTITSKSFFKPQGLFITENGELYIADPVAGKVFKYDTAGNFLAEFGKPEDIAFQGRPFNPGKIGVDRGGNMYIYGQGIADGIIQLSGKGEFLGFFTSNRVELTLTERILDLVFTEEQKARLYQKTPPIFSNVHVGHDGLVYTTSMNSSSAVKRHNIAGVNQLASVFSPVDPTDVWVDRTGIIFVPTNSGIIYVYSPDGEYIFSFGARNYSSTEKTDVSGLFTSLSALTLDSKGNVWTLDDEKSFIQTFAPTDYALRVYEALGLYIGRHYEQAVSVWQDVLSLNQMSVLAHNNIGKNYFALQDYEQALHHFGIAANRVDYSEAFWEVRNQVLQQRLGGIFIILTSLMLFSYLAKRIRTPLKATINEKTSVFLNWKPVHNLSTPFRILRHPLDTFYEIKRGRQGNLTSALCLYFATFLIYLWYKVGKGFIYQFVAIEDLDFKSIVLGFFALSLLFVLSNWLVSQVNDGEGNLSDVFKLFVHSFGPLLIALPLIILFSHVLTYNEAFFLTVALLVGQLWTGLNIFLGVQEVHNYGIKQTFKTLLSTLALMLVLVVVLIIVILMWEQLYNFFQAVFKEALRNVRL